MAAPVSEAADAVADASARFTTLLRSGLDPVRPVTRSSWTIAQLGAHLASGALAYRQMAGGGVSPYADIAARGATNQERLEAEAGRDLGALADMVDGSIAATLATCRALPDGAVVQWHGNMPMPLRPFLGAMVGELEFHGQDLARTVGVSWTITARAAQPIIDFVEVVTPHILEPATTQDLRARVQVRLRGYATTTYAFDSSSLTVSRHSVSRDSDARPDVVMSVEPVAFVQVAYRRSGLMRPILTGKALAWGRRPWLALEFPGFFQNP